jgi:hypothetical protein
MSAMQEKAAEVNGALTNMSSITSILKGCLFFFFLFGNQEKN